jgi:hypothetical protein
MKFAILGTDPDILQLVAAARQEGHEFAWVGDVRAVDAAKLGQFVIGFRDESATWETLLDRGIVEGVLAGRGHATTELRAEQLKRLAAEAIPMLVVHPVFESVLPYYEIDMARREAGGLIQHFNPSFNLSAIARLSEFIGAGQPDVGTIHQLTCERQVAGGDRETVLRAVAQDLEVLAMVAGDIRRVSATGPANAEASFASLQIQLATANLTSVRWSVGALTPNHSGLALTLLGERGMVTLRQESPSQESTKSWRIERNSDEHQTAEQLENFDPANAAVRRFASALESSSSSSAATQSTWSIATRAMEVVDAVELSLQKGRTIEVFQQQLTERLAFRGTMAALGCGLLLIAFLAVVVIAMVGGAEGIVREKMLPSWPLILLAVLAFFLLLQAVPLLAQKSKSRDAERSKPP